MHVYMLDNKLYCFSRFEFLLLVPCRSLSYGFLCPFGCEVMKAKHAYRNTC
jgi:hypothetical protein